MGNAESVKHMECMEFECQSLWFYASKKTTFFFIEDILFMQNKHFLFILDILEEKDISPFSSFISIPFVEFGVELMPVPTKALHTSKHT